MFVDRETELADLERAWQSPRAELIVVYGRRQVGKTALLREFMRDRPGVLWVAAANAEPILRRDLTNALWRVEHPESLEAGFAYENWERAFLAMGELARDRRVVIALDEFPYLVGAEASVPSVLQKVWDAALQHTRLMLILCGSHVGMMERTVLAYRAPLYGRRTGQMAMQPLPLRTTEAFFPRYAPAEQIAAYAVLGGMPAYLGQFDDSQPLLANIEDRVLRTSSYLYREPHFLLREELQEPRLYFAILQAIAGGHTRLHQVAQVVEMDRGAASRYVSILRELGLVERRVPITERQPERSRLGIYRLCDPFLAFWFRFVAPYLSLLESGYIEPVMQRVQAGLEQHVSFIFEDLCRAWVLVQAASGELPFLPERVGSWWDRETEIDVVALSDTEGALLVGECKWWSGPVGVNVLEQLKVKAARLNANGRYRHVSYILFARAGFTPDLQALAALQGVRLIQAAELIQSR
jgi:uncharacterized protein